MYPTISDLILDLFGIYIPLPIQSFGFFVALAFLAAAYFLSLELERKENQGLIKATIKREFIGLKATTNELVIAGSVGFLIGYKILEAILDYQGLVKNPQDFILSTKGSILGGILGAGLSIYQKWKEKDRLKLDKPKWVETAIPAKDHVSNIVAIAAIFGLLGAKIFHNLENPSEFIEDPIGSLISFSGLTFYGGLIVAAIAVLYYAKKNGIYWKHMVDAAAPSLILAYGVGRIGCQVAGDGDWGIPNDNPKPDWLSWAPDWTWAYNYPNNVLGIDLRTDFIRDGYTSISGNAYPTPFYEATLGILLFIFLWSIRKKITVPGVLFCIYLIVNGLERFFIEKIRVNTFIEILGSKITQAEIISFLLILAGITGIFYLKSNSKPKLVFPKS